MKTHLNFRSKGFTLMETVIAIGVLAVLLTGFIAVFAPATNGIRRSLGTQEADRLASALEQELSILRSGSTASSSNDTQEREERNSIGTSEIGKGRKIGGNSSGGDSSEITTAFEKSFEWIQNSTRVDDALLAYQYRANISNKRLDGTGEPYLDPNGLAGKDYILQPMVRPITDSLVFKDLEAIEGNIYVVKCKQLIFQDDGKGMKASDSREFINSDDTSASTYITYTDGALAIEASFYVLPSRTAAYIQGAAFKSRFPNLSNPVFIRNLAINR